MARALVEVVETREFQQRVSKRLTEAELDGLRLALAVDPEAGDLVPGGGGIRKLRWAIAGRGKSGGVRVIYYFHDRGAPVFLLDVYAKNEKDDLSDDRRRMLRDIAKDMATTIRAARRNR